MRVFGFTKVDRRRIYARQNKFESLALYSLYLKFAQSSFSKCEETIYEAMH